MNDDKANFLGAVFKVSPAMSSLARTFGDKTCSGAFRKREAGLGTILLFFQLSQDQIDFHKKYFQKQRKNKST